MKQNALFENNFLVEKIYVNVGKWLKNAKKGGFMTKMGERGKGKGERREGGGVKVWEDFLKISKLVN